MVKIKIDDRELEVEPGSTILQAALKNGIYIPHFCWHPKLSIAGNCRMCLVEVEKSPKLVISCATQVADGMVIRTNTEKVIKARNAILELMLINHPLDCPICDEAGECKLQEYAYKYGSGKSRFEEVKIHKPKRVQLGPYVILDTERCIMCSRCIRFTEEVAGQTVLTFIQRGTHVELTTFPGTQLDNPYSLNVTDICPVGALTNKDSRFKARVWEMSPTESICIGCARGCNIYIWVRRNEIIRLTPRINENVNSHWICDHGRLNTFKWINSPDRLSGAFIKRNGKLVEAGWDEAISMIASELRTYRKDEIAGIASAYSTNEDNYVFLKFMRDVIGTKNIGFMNHIKDGDEDNILIRADKTPNSLGVKLIGGWQEAQDTGIEKILKAIESGEIKAVYVMEDNIAKDPTVAKLLYNLELLVVHSPLKNETTDIADIVLSTPAYAEKNGTMVNFQGFVQRLRPAVTLLDHVRTLDGFSVTKWDKFASYNDRWSKVVKRDARSTWRLISSLASAMGVKFKYASAEDVFKEIAERIPAFNGLTYDLIGSNGAKIKEPVSVRSHV